MRLSTATNDMAYPLKVSARRSSNERPSRQGRHKLIVDKDIGTQKQKPAGLCESISEAISQASSGTVIKVTSNLYEEELVITKPGIILEPKEKGGEVTL